MKNKKILITGAAGFIGSFLAKRMLETGAETVGFDNLNDYYDVKLKAARLRILESFDRFEFVKADLADKKAVDDVFAKFKPDIVVNLAAQAGVRYSIDHPDAYIESNIIGFFNILEACRHHCPEHLVFASSSSVYGANKKVPFSVEDKADKPVSLYAATKKSNELMAYSYSKLYGIPTTGLRFFTVYGPMGRPDMAYFMFADKIVNGGVINVFNNGDMERDFTYIDDIVTGIENVMAAAPAADCGGVRYKLYNIGNSKPEKLMDYISCLEEALSEVYGRELRAEKCFLPMQPGDVPRTYADVSGLERDFGFKPNTPVREGLRRFAYWYKEFYG